MTLPPREVIQLSTLIRRLKDLGLAELRMNPFDSRALIVPCDCSDDPDAYFNPGCHVVVAGELMLQGADGRWLIATDSGYAYVDLSHGTVVHAITAAMYKLPAPCERTKLEDLTSETARPVLDELVAQYAHNFDESQEGGVFCRFSVCAAGCKKLVVDNGYEVLRGTRPSDDGYYLNPRLAAPLLRLMRTNELSCDCPRR